uniref:Tail fiber protein n=1 Tax=Candidatus Kentrum sp. SD TaxID=2126332 RepID=A0A450YCC4_9GAMM|nr:MAG: hypothetical protein BECKSD772F_GA0070984_100236 [Candidatus Kentron sp. SD]VFK39196.1 MAG: hypothetical protein BECKSD772E_GA0070983_100236 [Candidatus Kentron sp. SD]VFK77821.1 MAG: hypothetical protein BECKSD772D_GA0070982_100235 [Candidatus Kentron sp. SD]
MNITTKDRSALKSYFVKNSIPTESNFSDLIDGMLNLKDDGFAKTSGSPLSLEASGNTESQKKAINFYNKFSDKKPDWILCLNPRGTSGQANTAKRGFSIGDAEGNSKFFIDKATGNIGIGTTNPGYMLQIESSGANGIYVKGNTGGSAPSVDCHLVLESSSDYRGRGMFLPHRSSSDTSAAAWFVGVPYTGGGFQIGNSNLMSAGADNGSVRKDSAKLFINENGNVGIGTTSPGAKLDVSGDMRVGGGTPIQRIVIGTVGSDGRKTAGSGFTSQKTSGTGNYTITFSPPFSSTPVVLATCYGNNQDNLLNVNPTPSSAGVYIWDKDGSGENAPFSFIAIGI